MRRPRPRHNLKIAEFAGRRLDEVLGHEFALLVAWDLDVLRLAPDLLRLGSKVALKRALLQRPEEPIRVLEDNLRQGLSFAPELAKIHDIPHDPPRSRRCLPLQRGADLPRS